MTGSVCPPPPPLSQPPPPPDAVVLCPVFFRREAAAYACTEKGPMCVQFPRVRASFPFLSFWVFVFVCLSVCLFVCLFYFILFCFVLFLCCFCCCCCRFVFAHAENARIAESIILPQLQTSKRMLTDSFSEPKMCLRHFFASPSSLATY